MKCPNIPEIKAQWTGHDHWKCDACTALVRALAEAQGLAANLAQRLKEAKDRKVLLNGMTQEQKAAIFDIKAIVSDGVRHYEEACARTLKGE